MSKVPFAVSVDIVLQIAEEYFVLRTYHSSFSNSNKVVQGFVWMEVSILWDKYLKVQWLGYMVLRVMFL